MKNFEKVIKNVTSRKTKAIEQSRLDAKITTLTLPNNRVESFSIFFKSKFSENFGKIIETFYIERFEAVIFGGKLASPESTLTGPYYRDLNFKFFEVFLYLKIIKMSHLGN